MNKVITNKKRTCACGCGALVNRTYSKGHCNRGVPRSNEVKLKISQAMKGRSMSEGQKLRISQTMKGCVVSKEHRENLSKAMKGRTFRKGYKQSEESNRKRSITLMGHPVSENAIKYGANHPNWNGGSSFEPYCDVWADKEYKEDIRKRDGYICQNPDCWKSDYRLVVHHIDYDKKNCHPWNLITLCNSCNSRANANREYWEELYSKVLERYK